MVFFTTGGMYGYRYTIQGFPRFGDDDSRQAGGLPLGKTCIGNKQQEK
jgi:hypothetical protein